MQQVCIGRCAVFTIGSSLSSEEQESVSMKNLNLPDSAVLIIVNGRCV